jgi:putative phage-type endonuclease
MILDMEQRSAEWIAARVGKVTASRVCDAVAELKKANGEPVCRKNYRGDIVAEILTGRAVDNYVSPAMQFGIENEPFARAAYEIHKDCMVELAGFATHPRIERFGASPDGLVGKDGMVEFKCPNTTTHIEYLVGGGVPEEYKPQMMAGMACTERQWCDFISYDPRLPEHLQLFVVRFPRDEAQIVELERKVQKFLDEVDLMLGNLALVGMPEALMEAGL